MRGDLESVFLFSLASVEMDICFLMSMSVHSAFFFFLGNSIHSAMIMDLLPWLQLKWAASK
jgi:hypothetical protein